jgi:hypothetical protein
LVGIFGAFLRRYSSELPTGCKIRPGAILFTRTVGSSDEYLLKNAPNIPTKTHGNIPDILLGLDYLIDNPFVNGETLFIDGGESKKR